MVRQSKPWETCVQFAIAAVAVVVTGDASAKAAPVAPAPASALTSCHSTSPVPPTDAQIKALQALVLKYGVVTSDSVNKTTMTRCEFASLLNNLGNQLNELITSGYAEFVSKADLPIFQGLQEAFAVEYRTFAGAGSPATQEPPQQPEALYRAGFAVSRLRIDALEAITKKQEQPLFSPATKFHVETILALSVSAGRNR
ncbi:hypothetical protein [Stenomitos frigidus]|nr:hypothetical protein [Stenomitos frigidus]